MAKWFTRADWRAVAPEHWSDPFDPAKVKGVCIHYSGGHTLAGVDTAAHLRAIQQFYFAGANSGEDYADVAYNMAVDQAGGIWELRGLTVHGAANGPGGSNSTHPSIYLVMGGNDLVSDPMLAAVRELIIKWRQIYHGCLDIRPHSAFYSTSCPGTALAYIADGTFEPLDLAAQPAPQPSEEDEMPVMYRDTRYNNVFLLDGGVVHLSPKLKDHYAAKGVPLIEDTHEQTLTSILAQAGLAPSALVSAT